MLRVNQFAVNSINFLQKSWQFHDLKLYSFSRCSFKKETILFESKFTFIVLILRFYFRRAANSL